MRVVAGTLKGRSIRTVKGTNTRPTTDKVKESIFNMIGPYFSGEWALDLYGGSGSLGIESLSRGIKKVIFIDKDHVAIQTIKQNIKQLCLEDRVEIYRNDAFRALKVIIKRNFQFNLILLDPPYKNQQINEILQLIYEQELLEVGGFIMTECLKEDELTEKVGDIIQVKREIYGITAISVYERQT